MLGVKKQELSSRIAFKYVGLFLTCRVFFDVTVMRRGRHSWHQCAAGASSSNCKKFNALWYKMPQLSQRKWRFEINSKTSTNFTVVYWRKHYPREVLWSSRKVEICRFAGDFWRISDTCLAALRKLEGNHISLSIFKHD